MKLRSGTTSLFLATLLLIPLSAFAQTDASGSKKDQPYGATAQTFTGAVVSVDAKAGKLIMKTWDNHQKEFLVDPKAALTLRSTEAKLSDLKSGEQIIV